MNHSLTAIFLGILLYILYVLIPLIPAILIYRIFPDTKVSTEGFLGQLKINSTGAFSAYLVVTVIGYFIVNNIQGLINSSFFESVWTVKSKVIFLEKKDEEFIKDSKINDEDIKMKLDVRSTPDFSQKSLAAVNFPIYYEEDHSQVTFSYPGFESQVKHLHPDSVKFDFEKRTIHLGKIELKRINQEYNPTTSIPANSEGKFPSIPNFVVPKD